MKQCVMVVCFVVLGMCSFAGNKWGGMGEGIAAGINARIRAEQQRRQMELQEQEQRAAEERNRLMREEIRQREIEAQQQREEQAADYKRHMEREAAAADRRAKEAEAQRQREAAEKERKYWDSRCQFVDENQKRCLMPATSTGYCASHERKFKLEREQKEREEAERAEAERKRLEEVAERNRRYCEAYSKSGKQCRNEAEDGSDFCKRHRNWVSPEELELEAERLKAEKIRIEREQRKAARKAEAERRERMEEERERQDRMTMMFIISGVIAVVGGIFVFMIMRGSKCNKGSRYSRSNRH